MKTTSVVFASLFAIVAVGCAATAEEGKGQTESKETINECFAHYRLGSPEFSACLAGDCDEKCKVCTAPGVCTSSSTNGQCTDNKGVPTGVTCSGASAAPGPPAPAPAVPGAGAGAGDNTNPPAQTQDSESCPVKCTITTANGSTSNYSYDRFRNGKCIDNNGIPTGVTCK